MTTFQKLLVLLLFIVTFSFIYYFFVFLPDKEKVEQKRIEQIKSSCVKDVSELQELVRIQAKADGISKATLSISEKNYYYQNCLHRKGL